MTINEYKDKIKYYISDKSISDDLWNNPQFVKEICNFINETYKITAKFKVSDDGKTVIIYDTIGTVEGKTTKIALIDNGNMCVEHYKATTYSEGKSPHGGNSYCFSIDAKQIIYDKFGITLICQKYSDSMHRNDVPGKISEDFPLEMLSFKAYMTRGEYKYKEQYELIPQFAAYNKNPIWPLCCHFIPPAKCEKPKVEVFLRLNSDIIMVEQGKTRPKYEWGYNDFSLRENYMPEYSKCIKFSKNNSLPIIAEYDRSKRDWKINVEQYPCFIGMTIEDIVKDGSTIVQLTPLQLSIRKVMQKIKTSTLGKRK